MESPFLDVPVNVIKTFREWSNDEDEITRKNPLIAPGDLEAISVYEYNDNETFTYENELNEFQIMEQQVAPNVTTIKIGEVTFSIADSTKASSEEYKEPAFSGNPLLIISSKDRGQQISKNFIVGEYVQAQSGKYKFNYSRIDSSLVDNLQKLRSFLGKKITVVDGYYSPKYLKEQLKIKDSQKILLNPHIKGRAVKIYIPGYKGMIKQIAIAAIVACDKDINIGIGNSTMTLYVKEGLTSGPTALPEDFQRIKSYIADEKTKVETYTFCVDVKRLLQTHFSSYEKLMNKALSAFAVGILKIHYSQRDIPVEWTDWQTPVDNIISMMYEKSITKNPNVILYSLAYSFFGNLFRYYFKDKSGMAANTVRSITDALTTDNDRKNQGTPGNFIPVQNEPDKKRFIDYCRQRILLGSQFKRNTNSLVPVTFFDWKDNADDKNFLKQMTGIIQNVYVKNRYVYNVPAQQSPVGGTSRQMKLSDPNPDKPLKDFTGRYWAQFASDHPTLHGRYLLINQAGNYISGKTGGIYKFPVKNLRNTIVEFYGKIDDKGNAVCNLYPQQTLIIKKDQSQTRLYIIDNPSDKIILNVPVISRSKNPVISNNIVNSFSKINKKQEELLLTLAWVQPLPEQLKNYFESFKKSENEITDAITKYYNEDETVPSVRETRLSGYVSNLDVANNNYLKLPPMFNQFATYYAKYFYSVSPHWSPASDRETMSILDWIKKMLADYRDLKGTAYVEKRFKSLYEYFVVDTKIPDVIYQYKIKLKLKAFGFGPFARSSGTITIENKTDYGKYPKAEKWPASKKSEDYPITLWNATLSLNPGKWLPKISAGQTIEAAIATSAYYSTTDFSGADVQVTEGKVFEIPIGIKHGGLKTSTKLGIGGVVVLIDGHGKRTLEFTSDLSLSLPDTIEIEPSDASAGEGTFEKIAGFLPSITMYKGSIDTKSTSLDIISVPPPESFNASYQIQSTKYFKHDDATLSQQAIEAVGKLCAEELVAFSDPESKVEIYGHTDASGKPEYNLALSAARAANTWQAIEDRLGIKLKAKLKNISGLGENEANKKFGQFTEKNAWLRRVVIIINGRAVLSLGEI